MPYEHLLPERLRGRNERIDDRFAPAEPAAAGDSHEPLFVREGE
jgi:hypothetical protein